MADPAQPVCRGDVVLRKNRAWLVVSVCRKSCGLVPIIGQTLPRHRADVTVAGLCVAGSIARRRSVTSAPLRLRLNRKADAIAEETTQHPPPPEPVTEDASIVPGESIQSLTETDAAAKQKRRTNLAKRFSRLPG